MEYRIERIGGVRCSIWSHGQGGPVIYWGTAHGDQQEGNVADRMAASPSEIPWTLVVYEAENWNRDYSPWALPSVKGEAEFTGGAKQMLAWLTDVCIPHMENSLPCAAPSRMIGGYSLSGLFSLFAFFESRMFDGVASCSGSLWYPGWKEYAEGQKAPEGSCVYLSLGRKEEKTRSRKMAIVGDMTRWQHTQMQQDGNVRASELYWHNGGHFADVDQRIAQGFIWLIEHTKR
ncbi:MAG: hypothetical protein IJ418_19590 [Clostridia bacterium]|nr:hypothetical protein [Clostridia bacterium]